MCRKRLDSIDYFPSGMEEYLNTYGWHFNKKLCDYAVAKMKISHSPGQSDKLKASIRDEVEAVLKKYGVEIADYHEYDAVYVFNMAKADYYGSSLGDELHLALFVKDYLEDKDGYDEIAMTRYYADCIARGEMPSWDDCI